MQRIIAADPTIPELPLKDVVFRIYRDIRFSNDPTPYKPHYSVAFSRTGRKGPYACYYVHCEPGSCFVGGGIWHPDASHLAKLRASIDERPRRWRRVLLEDGFRATFLPGAKRGDEKSCLKAFCKSNGENALKTKPKVGDCPFPPSSYIPRWTHTSDAEVQHVPHSVFGNLLGSPGGSIRSGSGRNRGSHLGECRPRKPSNETAANPSRNHRASTPITETSSCSSCATSRWGRRSLTVLSPRTTARTRSWILSGPWLDM